MDTTVEGGIATLKIPELLSWSELESLGEAIDSAQSKPEVRALLLAGTAGDFSLGFPVSGGAELGARGAAEASRAGQLVLDKLASSGKPCLAALSGRVLGAGLEVALACHLRVMSASGRIGLPYLSEGRMPALGATQRLPRLIGRGAALQLLLSGAEIGSEEALALGLVNWAVPDEDLLSHSRERLEDCLAAGPVATKHLLEALNEGPELPLDDALALESSLFALTEVSGEAEEGRAAAREGRSPAFRADGGADRG